MTVQSPAARATSADRNVDRRHVPAIRVPMPRPRRLLVGDVMTRDVVAVTPAASFHVMAGLMRRTGVSALPVVDENGELLGIVSEADLLPKENPNPPRRRWVPESGESTDRRRKAGGMVAADVMTSPVTSIGPRASLAAAARLLEHHRIKRLAVLDGDGRMVGIVSRSDLLAAFSRSDDEIRLDVVEGVIPRWLMVEPMSLLVAVRDGVVRIEGVVERRSEADILTHLVRGLDGVVDVDNAVSYRWNDRNVALSRELHIA